MAIQEITQHTYQEIRADLSEDIPVSTLAKRYGLGERRLRQIRDSKSFKGYLQKRANERRKRAENTPATASQGTHDLEQESQQFLVNTVDNESVPEDKAKPTAEGEIDQRSDKEKADTAKKLENARLAEELRAEIKQEKLAVAIAVFVIALALVGVFAIIVLITNR